MPREAEPSDLEPVFPWADWEKLLLESPTKALIFDRDDFGEMTPRAFKEKVQRAFPNPKVHAKIRGDEVLVTFDA